MRWIARFFGLLALAGAFAAAVLDGARWLANGIFAPTSTGDALEWLSPRTLGTARRFVDQRIGGWLWNDVVMPALVFPFFAALIVIGALLFILSREPPPLIGRSTRDR